MADKTLIQLNRFNRSGADSFANGYELKDGEPIFDLRTNRFYIGTSTDNIGNSITPTVQNLYTNGQYFVPINDKKPIPTSYISDGAITTAKINNRAVTNEKIADGAVTNDKLTLSEYGINLDRIDIPDKSIPFDKISGYVPYDRISGKPTTTDASTITGRIKYENLPALEFNNTMPVKGTTYNASLCAVYAANDQLGNFIHKKYGSQLVANTSASELRLVSPDSTVLSRISGDTLAQLVGYNSSGVTFNGRISWDNVDDKPAMLNLSSSIGNATQPVYYDANTRTFGLCEPIGLIRLGDVISVGDGSTYKSSLDGVAFRAESSMWVAVFASVKVKDSGGDVYWYSGVGFTNTSYLSNCVLLDLSISGDYDVEIELKRQDKTFHITASAKKWTISQLKCKVYKLL